MATTSKRSPVLDRAASGEVNSIRFYASPICTGAGAQLRTAPKTRAKSKGQRNLGLQKFKGLRHDSDILRCQSHPRQRRSVVATRPRPGIKFDLFTEKGNASASHLEAAGSTQGALSRSVRISSVGMQRQYPIFIQNDEANDTQEERES